MTKYNKALAKVEFTQEGEGGTREFGGRAEAGQGKARAEGGRKADKAQRQGNGVSSKVSYLIDVPLQKVLFLSKYHCCLGLGLVCFSTFQTIGR